MGWCCRWPDVKIGIIYNTEKWRLFIPFLFINAPIATQRQQISLFTSNACCSNERNLQNMHRTLQALKCKNLCWNMCGDLILIGILLGTQRGFTEYLKYPNMTIFFLIRANQVRVSHIYEQLSLVRMLRVLLKSVFHSCVDDYYVSSLYAYNLKTSKFVGMCYLLFLPIFPRFI